MRIVFAALAVAAGVLIFTGTALAVASFVTPIKAAYCGLSEGERPPHLICWRPSDGLTLTIARFGRAQKAINPQNRGFHQIAGRVLRYGQTWSGASSFKCTSRRTGLTCVNRSRHGWWLGRHKSRLF